MNPSFKINPSFIDNSAIQSRADSYVTVTVDVGRVLQSWRESLFSYEWMRPDGQLKSGAELPEKEQPKRAAVEDSLRKKEPLEKPVLGIGMMDNIEIGVGRATFLTLAAMGINNIPVHIPKSHRDEFSSFLAAS